MSETGNRLWAAYVTAVVGDGLTQKEVAERVSEKYGDEVRQATVSRWMDPLNSAIPEPARVAAFALAFGRPVLQAFVAAGLLEMADARAGLTDDDAAFVAKLGREVSKVRRTKGASPAPRRRRPQPPRE